MLKTRLDKKHTKLQENVADFLIAADCRLNCQNAHTILHMVSVR